MPFIRYELGDGPRCVAARVPAVAVANVRGRAWPHPRYDSDPRRKVDFRHLLPTLVEGIDWIEQFQVVQKELDRVQLKLVTPDRSAAERGLRSFDRRFTPSLVRRSGWKWSLWTKSRAPQPASTGRLFQKSRSAFECHCPQRHRFANRRVGEHCRQSRGRAPDGLTDMYNNNKQ